jgi:hypothetical protein
MPKEKVLDNFQDLKVLQDEELQSKVSNQAKEGEQVVASFFQRVKLDTRLDKLGKAAISRDNYYIDEAEYQGLLRERAALVESFENIPIVIEKRAKFKKLHIQLYNDERPAGNGRLIPIVPPEGELSTAYNDLQNEIAAAEKCYQDVVLVEVENRISHLRNSLSEANIRKVEQGEWDRGRK